MPFFINYTQSVGKGPKAFTASKAAQSTIDALYDAFFLEQCPTAVKLVKRLKGKQLDYDALFMNVGAALATLSREELGLEEKEAA